MPKPYTFPTLYNEALQLDVSRLKKWGYLDQYTKKSGTINWGRNGENIGRISICANINSIENYIELDYNFRDTPRNYRVYLVSMPSNLGKGEIWYFLCPHTGKRCRKLYLIGGYFFHRTAFNGCMYESQTKSKKWRQMESLFNRYFNGERYFEQLYSKHFKRHYNGKPTKRYLKLMQKVSDVDKYSVKDIDRLILMGG